MLFSSCEKENCRTQGTHDGYLEHAEPAAVVYYRAGCLLAGWILCLFVWTTWTSFSKTRSANSVVVNEDATITELTRSILEGAAFDSASDTDTNTDCDDDGSAPHQLLQWLTTCTLGIWSSARSLGRNRMA